MRFAFWIFAVSLLAGACGGNVVVDGESGAGGEIGAGGESGAGGTGIVCSDAGPQDLPAAQRQCATASDCLIEPVSQPYCTTYEVGVASSELGAFQAYESACDKPSGPTHTCPIFTVMTITQDGKITPGSEMVQVQVACQGGVCSTFTQ
jgi:hypothetical protein